MSNEKPQDLVEWAAWGAYALLVKQGEIEEWLRGQGHLETFGEAMGRWRDNYIFNGDWENNPEKATIEASAALYEICQNHGLCEVLKSRYQSLRETFSKEPPARVRGEEGPQWIGKRSLVLNTARQHMEELAQRVT